MGRMTRVILTQSELKNRQNVRYKRKCYTLSVSYSNIFPFRRNVYVKKTDSIFENNSKSISGRSRRLAHRQDVGALWGELLHLRTPQVQPAKSNGIQTAVLEHALSGQTRIHGERIFFAYVSVKSRRCTKRLTEAPPDCSSYPQPRPTAHY